MMRRVLALASALVLAVVPVRAQIGFDDLSGGANLIADGYAGFNWGGFYELDGCVFHPVSGYCEGTVSPNNAAYNGFGSDVAITGPASFLFGGGWFTAAWNNNLQLDITGLFEGGTLFSTTLDLSPGAAFFFAANWAGIDELRFSSYGGTNAGLDGEGNHFVMDDISFERVDSTVPEPATMTLLATGLAGMAAARRRKKA